MREGLWRTKKGGPNKSKKLQESPRKSKNVKKKIWEAGEAVRNGAQRCATVRKQFFPGDNGSAHIKKMPFWGLRNSLSAGKYMYHEENLHPDSILKSRTRLLFKNCPFWAKTVSDFCS